MTCPPNKMDISLPPGVPRLARIVKYDPAAGKAKVKLANVSETIVDSPNIEISIPNAFYSSDGLFVGGLVQVNTPITIMQGEGGRWFFNSFLMTNGLTAPTLTAGQLLIQSSSLCQITLDTKNNIDIGSPTDGLHMYLDNNSSKSLLTSTLNNVFSFSEAKRVVDGIVKREVKKLANYPPSVKLESDDYFSAIYPIALDPAVSTSGSFINQVKNPPFVEAREMVYEFAYSYDVNDDLTESQLYNKSGKTSDAITGSSTATNRRQSRADTLSLSLVAPNFLMETVKGTVIDIFGNILNINRVPIPIGKSQDLTLNTANGNNITSTAFNNIKQFERNSIAYHFELNARKNLGLNNTTNNNLLNILDYNSDADYARIRSRFFFDIDKEGQFKLNVPASSETGNIALLARYENYSTLGPEENGNPNKLFYRQDNLDIFLDSFSTQDITVLTDGGAVATPIDRITGSHIMKGMPFHSITNSLQMFQPTIASQALNFQYNEAVDLSAIPTIANVVSSTISVGGPMPNAGGRSGSMNFDGSLEVSIGANTVDRQSLWLDTAGGVLANVGRDLNNVSMGLSLDGDLLIQVGGIGVASDSRFSSVNNAYRNGAVDVRVLTNGYVSVVRIDQNGITVATPGDIVLKGRNVTIAAEGSLIMQSDNVSVNGRPINLYPVTSI